MNTEPLIEWAKKRGYGVAWGPYRVLLDAWEELQERRRMGEIDPAFDEDYLAPSFDCPAEGGDGSPWVVVVVVPRPAHFVTFTPEGREIKLVLPPTYVGYRRTTRDVIEDLDSSVFGGRGALFPLRGPLKGIATRLGLAVYGRNNVTYAEGVGSYFQLVGCCTSEDLSEGASAVHAPACLDACESCGACADACPTQAIPEERFLLRAERCLTYFNEQEGEFPSWVPEWSHLCLMGCMMCQEVCPENAGRLRVEDSGVAFTEEETQILLDGEADPGGAGGRALNERLSPLGLSEEPAHFWRNLRAAVSALA